ELGAVLVETFRRRTGLVGATGMRAQMALDKTTHAFARQRLLFRQGQVKRQISGHAALPRGSLSKTQGCWHRNGPTDRSQSLKFQYTLATHSPAGSSHRSPSAATITTPEYPALHLRGPA